MLSPVLLYYNTLVCKNVKAQGKHCNVNDIQLRRFQSMKRALLTAFHSSNEARHCGCYMFPTSRNWRGPARVSDLGHHSRAGDSNLKIHYSLGLGQRLLRLLKLHTLHSFTNCTASSIVNGCSAQSTWAVHMVLSGEMGIAFEAAS